jgi:UPF0271 protein
MRLSPPEVYDTVLYQISVLKGMTEAAGARLHHVKPHGALYNDAAVNDELAAAIAAAVIACDPKLVLYGLSGSCLVTEAQKAGLKTANEVFSDRTYMPDGTLTPRKRKDALIEDAAAAIEQAVGMAKHGSVTAVNGEKFPITADTVCIHGDSRKAVEFAKSINGKIRELGIEIKTIS